MEERAAAFPQVTITSGSSRNRTTARKLFGGDFIPPQQETRSAEARLTQPLFTWGRSGPRSARRRSGSGSPTTSCACSGRRRATARVRPLSTTSCSPGSSTHRRAEPGAETAPPGRGAQEAGHRPGHRLRCPGRRGRGGERPARRDPHGEYDPDRTAAASFLLAMEGGEVDASGTLVSAVDPHPPTRRRCRCAGKPAGAPELGTGSGSRRSS